MLMSESEELRGMRSATIYTSTFSDDVSQVVGIVDQDGK
jgi:hypothetical protein